MSEHDIIAGLSSLRTAAPDGLAEAVLAEAGLIDRYERIDGPLGPLYVAFNRRGVSAVVPASDDATFLEIFARRVGRRVVPGTLPELLRRRLAKTLETGKLGELDVDLDGLSDFQRAVLRKAAEIPPGEVRSYGWIAREIGKPGAVRAVGTALGNNPVPVVVPCHRVARSDGRLGEYAFGPEMKRALLEREGLDPDYEQLTARGVRFTGSDSTKIYCHPTCRHARRITAGHRVEFHDASEAERSGYRPCRVCRPAA